MKKMLILTTILSIMFSPIRVKANNDELENEDNTFMEKVENTDYYKEYSDQISEVIVNRSVETDEGIRKTILFSLESRDREESLVFIGDDKGVLDVLVISYTDDTVYIDDLVNKQTTRLNQQKGPVYQCIKKTCTAWKTDLSIVSAPGCAAIVGQPCTNLAVILNKPYIAVLCKLGVYIACSATIKKKCTHYYEELSVCSL